MVRLYLLFIREKQWNDRRWCGIIDDTRGERNFEVVGVIAMVTMDNFDSSSFDIYDINLVQKEVDGGVLSFEQIDSIRDFPDSKSIIISGLKQDTFDYFVNTYGKQFQTITFWKNKGVADLSALSSLSDVEYISYFLIRKQANSGI